MLISEFYPASHNKIGSQQEEIHDVNGSFMRLYPAKFERDPLDRMEYAE